MVFFRIKWNNQVWFEQALGYYKKFLGMYVCRAVIKVLVAIRLYRQSKLLVYIYIYIYSLHLYLLFLSKTPGTGPQE